MLLYETALYREPNLLQLLSLSFVLIIPYQVSPGSIASTGLTNGDLILRIGEKDTSDLTFSQSQDIIKQSGNLLQFQIAKAWVIFHYIFHIRLYCLGLFCGQNLRVDWIISSANTSVRMTIYLLLFRYLSMQLTHWYLGTITGFFCTQH